MGWDVGGGGRGAVLGFGGAAGVEVEWVPRLGIMFDLGTTVGLLRLAEDRVERIGMKLKSGRRRYSPSYAEKYCQLHLGIAKLSLSSQSIGYSL